MYNNYSYNASVNSFAVVLLVVMATALIISLAIYFFQAYGVYRIAKNRGIRGAGCAFIPIIGSFVMGSIADSINARISKRSHYKNALLITGIVNIVVGIFPVVTSINALSKLDKELLEILNNSPIFGLISLVSLAFSVITYMALYRIYSDYAANSATAYLVLSIIIPITMPFLIFSIRNKESVSIKLSQDTYYNQFNQYDNNYNSTQPNTGYNNQGYNQYGQQNMYQDNNFNTQPTANFNNQPNAPYPQNQYQANDFNQGYNTQPTANFNRQPSINNFEKPLAPFQPYHDGNMNQNQVDDDIAANEQFNPFDDNNNDSNVNP